MSSFLIIQTAFIGDVILATGILEKLRTFYPDATLDFLVRKGNEGILKDHPGIRTLYVWDKKGGKYRNLWRIARQIRRQKYDYVINLQRYATTGWLTVFSGARTTIGFDKNPLARFFSKAVPHTFEGQHEIERNHALIQDLTDSPPARPRLYPSKEDCEIVSSYKSKPYVCIAPTSVWFTKQFPADKWIELIRHLPDSYVVYLLGAPTDREACDRIAHESNRTEVYNRAGELSLLASAALMRDAAMNYVNDSAPMHLASAMNAPVCAVYCSTVPSFGYGPLSDRSFVVEKEEPLVCRPCGLHGHKACPEGHFRCAKDIRIEQLLSCLNQD
jgi:heptosyltransferase-2